MNTISETIGSDFDISVAPPAEYVSNDTRQLLPEGTYDLLINEFEQDEDREGNPRYAIHVQEAEVAEGEYAGRRVYNLRFFATPFQRNGVTVSQLGDFLAGIDDTADWSAGEDNDERFANAMALVQKAKDQRIPVRMKLRWVAFDSDYYLTLEGASAPNKSPEQKAARKAATIRGMHNFRTLPDGTVIPEAVGQLGTVLTARVEVDRVVRSSKRDR